ncbi:MAG: hypothetical protein ACOYLG_13085 [Chitinophagaceae bacterium]
MSNKIFGTDIVDQSASVEVKKLQTDLQSLLNTFIQTSGAVDLMRKALSNVTGYNNVSDALDKNTKALDEMQRVKNQIIALQRQIAVMNSDEYKSLVTLREERNKNNRELREEAKAVVYASDAYKKLEAEYSKAAREAKNLGAELGTNSKQFVDAAQKANLLNDKLKAIDAGMGVHTRNVGNYASATHSLSQVLREMPAFTYSAQTGLMGISNNLPILIDKFREVQAQTGSAGSALKVFGASLLSFPNILTVVIGLFTIFYKEIMQFVTGTKQASEAAKQLFESVGSETGKLEALTRQLDNHNLSTQERIRAAKELKDLYPTALKNYSAEEIAAGKAADAIMSIRNALVAVAMARAYQTELEKKAAERYELERKLALKKSELMRAEADEAAKLEATRATAGAKNQQFTINSYNTAVKNTNALKDEIRDLQTTAIETEMAMNSLAEKIGNMTSRAAIIGPNKTTPQGGGKTTPQGDTIPVVDIPKDLTDEEIQDLKKYYDDLNKWIAKIAAEYTADPVIQQSILGDIAENMPGDPTTEAQARDIANALKERIQQQLDDKNNKALKIRRIELDMQAVQMGASFLSSLNDIIYNAEIASIERRDRKLKDSYDQRKQLIENSYSIQADREKQLKKLEAERAAQQRGIDNQRRAADRRRALTNKGLAVAEIIANTALAVIKAFTEGDPYTKAGRAAFAAAIGAVSLAKALSVQIPAYKDGTGPDGHKGGLAIVGDGGVPEYIQEPGKKGYWSKPFAEIVDLPAKTKVTPPEKLLQNLMYKTMASLGKMGGKITSETFAEQMMKDYESLSNEMKETRKVLQAKKLSVTINGDLAHMIRMKELIK